MAKAKTYKGEAVLDLPATLRFRADFVGLLKPSVIGGVDVHVVLPDFEWDDGWFKPVLHPRANVDWLDSFVGRPDEDDPGFPFGRAEGAGASDEIVSLWATRLLILPRAKISLSGARAFRDAADGWLDLLTTWLDVVDFRDLRQKTVQTEHFGKAAYVWVDSTPTGKLFRGRRILKLNFGGPTLGISRWQWGKILEKTGANVAPPEAHLFLRDARHARNAGRYRRSVLDSATAAELSLAKLRDDIVSGADKRLAAYIAKEVRQLHGISEFLKAMKVTLPPGIKTSITEPRNKAIHQGHEPDDLTASKALETAEETVELAFPRKHLL